MATLTYESTDRRGYRLRVYAPGDSTRRHSIWLGDLPEREATVIRRHVEAIVESRKLGTPMPGETIRWLGHAPAAPRRKLTPILGTARSVTEAVDDFLASISRTLKPSTCASYEQSLGQFTARFGNRQMRSLTAAEIDDWLAARNVSANTIAGHAKKIRTWLRWCARMDQGYIDDLRITTPASIGAAKNTYLDAADLDRWIAHFRRDPEMWAALSIARWSGVRVPSEIVALTRAAVDWENNHLLIPDAKRSKRQSRGPPIVRKTPIFPELVEPLQAVWTMSRLGDVGTAPTAPLLPSITAAGGDRFVRRCRDALAEIGIPAWSRLFTSLRATRETDLIRRFGMRAACEWIGNTPAVAMRHYEQITAETWKEATGERSPSKTPPTAENTT